MVVYFQFTIRYDVHGHFHARGGDHGHDDGDGEHDPRPHEHHNENDAHLLRCRDDDCGDLRHRVHAHDDVTHVDGDDADHEFRANDYENDDLNQ